MRKLVNILFISLVLISCEQYPEPGSETMESFSFDYLGNFQMAEAGSYLAEDIGVRVNYNSPNSTSGKSFYMELEILNGDGKVDKQKILADENGVMTTKWQLGSTVNEQVIGGEMFDSSGKLYADFEMRATALLMDDWNKITKGYLVGIDDMVRDTIRQRTIMYNERKIWVLKNNFYSWEPMDFPFSTGIRFMDMTNDGTVFAAGWNGALYKTEDWGENWDYVSHPIPENEYHYNFNITSDDYLWATKRSKGVFYSIDKGLTWVRDTTERVKDTRLGPIYKYQDSYLAIAGDPLSIIQKHKDSLAWTDIKTPEYSLSMYVPNDSTIIAQNQGGFKLHKSTNDGLTFNEVFSPYTEMGGGNLWHVYNKLHDNYYILAPSNGVWKTKDFDEFEQLIEISTYQSKLFIDHTGAIYAAGSNFSNAEDEATYILPYSP